MRRRESRGRCFECGCRTAGIHFSERIVCTKLRATYNVDFWAAAELTALLTLADVAEGTAEELISLGRGVDEGEIEAAVEWEVLKFELVDTNADSSDWDTGPEAKLLTSELPSEADGAGAAMSTLCSARSSVRRRKA